MKVIDEDKIKDMLIKSYHEMTIGEVHNLTIEDLLTQSVEATLCALRSGGVPGFLIVTPTEVHFSERESPTKDSVKGHQVFIPMLDDEEEDES